MQDFRKLRAWHSAIDLAVLTRAITARFPRVGYAELKAQMISAAESVGHNIVEGCGATSQKDFARFLDSSAKSSLEVEGQLELCVRYGILSPAGCRRACTQAADTRRMVRGLQAKIRRVEMERERKKSE